jgi:hypothetical protein
MIKLLPLLSLIIVMAIGYFVTGCIDRAQKWRDSMDETLRYQHMEGL